MRPTAGELTLIRKDVETTFNTTCTVTRPDRDLSSTSPTGYGNVATTPTTVHEHLPCRVAPSGLTPSERSLADQFQTQSMWRVLVPAGTEIRDKDRISVADGRQFDVITTLWRPYETKRIVLVNQRGQA